MHDVPSGHRLRRRDLLRLLAAGTSVSALMAVSSVEALARGTVARSTAAAPIILAQATPATNQLNVAWNAAPPNLNPLNAVSQA